MKEREGKTHKKRPVYRETELEMERQKGTLIIIIKKFFLIAGFCK